MALNNGVEITWLGHAAFRIKSPSGKIILTDPFVAENPATPANMKNVGHVDVILPSHAHSDNFGDTVSIAKATGATVVAIFEIAQWVGQQGVKNTVGMNIGGTADVQGIKITMTPAWHSSSIYDNGRLLPGGTAVGYVIELENGFTIYFAGDTAIFMDMQLIGKLYEPDLAILPIGDHFTMGPKAAAEAIRLLGVKQVIPMHYGTFPVLTGTPEQLQQEAHDIEGLHIYTLNPGDTLT
jgi:L-ascorbate metabolism protein UlaG (beta-lactamase superfamily)